MGRKTHRTKSYLSAGKSSTSKHHSAKKVADVETAIKKKRNVRKGNCFNCGCDETETDLWRSDIFAPKGVKRMVCNACGLWSRDHRCYRPQHMWKHLKTRAEKAEPITTHSTVIVGAFLHHSRTPSPIYVHSELMTPEEQPCIPLPLPPAPSPTNDYMSLAPKKISDDDLVAANTLLSMMSKSSIHEAPPPLAKAPSLYHHRSHHSFSEYDSYPPVPLAHCQLFNMAPHSAYVPSWMDTHVPHTYIAPTTPTQANYGRRNSYPEYGYHTTPARTTVSESTTPVGSRRHSVLRPSIANLCDSAAPSPRSSSPEGVLPSLTHERRWSQNSQSSSSQASLQSPQTPRLALSRAPLYKGEADSVPDFGRLALY